MLALRGGHRGGWPFKLTADLLETAVQGAAREPLTLQNIADKIKEAHPTAPEFSLDRLSAGLKRRGYSPKRCRRSLKKREPVLFEAARTNLSNAKQAALAGAIPPGLPG